MEEDLKQLLQDRIAQLESRECNPPMSPDEQDAEEGFQVASAAARALVADEKIESDEKLRVLQSMFADCVANVRALEYDLGLEEKRLSVAEIDYSELGEDLKKVEGLSDKLKGLSRELSKKNKAMMEKSAKRTTEERGKREDIVKKFDEAMHDINARLSTDIYVATDKDDVVSKLEADLDGLQKRYDEREKKFEESVNEAVKIERRECDELWKAKESYEKDELAVLIERRSLMDLRKQSRVLCRDIDVLSYKKQDVERNSKDREAEMKRQGADIDRMEQSEGELDRAMTKLFMGTESLRETSRELMVGVKVEEEELEFWKAKSKGEMEKRERLERLCRTLTEERTIMRKEVRAMQTAWGVLEGEIENIRVEMSEK